MVPRRSRFDDRNDDREDGLQKTKMKKSMMRIDGTKMWTRRRLSKMNRHALPSIKKHGEDDDEKKYELAQQ